MRSSRIIFICALLVLFPITTPEAGAQRQDRVVRPQSQAANSARFRARAASERLASARGLLGMQFTISQEFLNAPFSLTPRQPSVQGHGWLNAQRAHRFLTRIPGLSDHDGVIMFQSIGSDDFAEIYLENPTGKRFLVDCLVYGSQHMRASAGNVTAEVNALSPATLSVVTPPGEDRIRIDAVDNDGWRLFGCEITRIQ